MTTQLPVADCDARVRHTGSETCGATRPFPVFPEGECGDCGTSLGEAIDLGVTSRRQQTDIAPVVAQTIQDDEHTVQCACGKVHHAKRAEGVPDARTSFGVNLQAWCIYLLVVHAIPVGRVVAIAGSLTGTAPSAGWVHGLLERAAAALEQVDKVIAALLTLAGG